MAAKQGKGEQVHSWMGKCWEMLVEDLTAMKEKGQETMAHMKPEVKEKKAESREQQQTQGDPAGRKCSNTCLPTCPTDLGASIVCEDEVERRAILGGHPMDMRFQ